MQRIIHTYSRKSREWVAAKGRLYQSSADSRMKSVWQSAACFRGKVVLDIGCSSGLQTALLSTKAKGVIGLEPTKDFYLQAVDFIKSCGIRNTKLVHNTLGDFIRLGKHLKLKIDAVFASRILYHLSEQEIQLLINDIFPRCQKVILVSREVPRGGRRGVGNKRSLFSKKAITGLLKATGFTPKVLRRAGEDVFVLGYKLA